MQFEREVEDARRGHVAWGLQDRITRELSRNPRLKVHSTGTIARAIQQTGGFADSAAALLGARYVLGGKVTESQGQQNVVVSLHMEGRPVPVWRGAFGADWSLRRMESAIAAAVERGVFGDVEETRPLRRTANDEAYDALVMGDYHLMVSTVAAADSARLQYERALRLDPGSTEAALRLARAIVVLLERGGRVPNQTPTTAMNHAATLTTQALRADSTLGDAWTIRAMVARLRDPVRFDGALAAHVRAVYLSPNDADAEHEFGMTLMRLGDDRTADVHLRRALALEPNRGNTLAALAELALRAKNWSMACAASNASIEVWGFDPLPYGVRARARLRLSQTRDAYSDAETAARLTSNPWVGALDILVQVGANNMERARRQSLPLAARWLHPGQSLAPRDAAYLALAFAAVRDRPRAVEAIRRARPAGADLVTELRDSGLDAVRSDTAIVRILSEARGTRPARRR
jgi:tetratricopeptide (TPR) repeat protein/TolB-like protein